MKALEPDYRPISFLFSEGPLRLVVPIVSLCFKKAFFVFIFTCFFISRI